MSITAPESAHARGVTPPALPGHTIGHALAHTAAHLGEREALVEKLGLRKMATA